MLVLRGTIVNQSVPECSTLVSRVVFVLKRTRTVLIRDFSVIIRAITDLTEVCS